MAKKFLTGLSLVVLDADPSTGSEGELYFNSSASVAKIYQAGAWSVLGAGGGGGSTTVSTTEPSSPEIGDSWYKNDTGEFYIYDGTYWVEVNGVVGLTEEQVQDYVSPLFIHNNHTNITATYDDINNEILLEGASTVSGSLSNIDSIVYPDYITFDTTPENSSEEPGTLSWDEDFETLKLQANDITLQIGQEHVVRVKNGSGSTAIPNMRVVMFSGATGDTVEVTPALSTASYEPELLVGITTEEIPADGFGFVTQFGFVNKVNTSTPGWSLGDLLYVDPANPGLLTNVKPSAPNWNFSIAAVTRVHATTGRILVRAIPGKHLHDLVDVSMSGSVQNNEILAYDLSNGVWINKTADESGLLTISSASTTYAPIVNPTFTGQVILPSNVKFENGTNDLIIGSYSGKNNSVVFGHRAGESLPLAGNADNIIAIGFRAMATNNWGQYSVAVGSDALLGSGNQGSFNTAIGGNSLAALGGAGSLAQNVSNTAIGYNSGSAIFSGGKNVIIGSNSGSTINGLSNNIIISDGDGNIRAQYLSASSGWTLGTIVSGTWNGTTIGLANGGTGSTTRSAAITNLQGYGFYSSNTTLTNTSPQTIFANPSSGGITLTLPSVTTLALGWSFNIKNTDATRSVTIDTSSGSFVAGLEPGMSVRLVCVNTNSSAATSWDVVFNGSDGVTGTGNLVLSTSPFISTAINTTSTSFNLLNTTATTMNAFGAATTLNIGTTSTAAKTMNLFTAATISGATKTLNIGTGGASGSTTAVNIGSSTSGATNNITLNGTTAVPRINLNGMALIEASSGTSSATSSFNTTVYSSAEYIVYASTASGNYVSKVLMLARGTAEPVITEYAILTQGTAPTVTITPSYSAPNAVLTVAVTSGTNIEIIATEVSI
jgi:hypothetical protein